MRFYDKIMYCKTSGYSYFSKGNAKVYVIDLQSFLYFQVLIMSNINIINGRYFG